MSRLRIALQRIIYALCNFIIPSKYRRTKVIRAFFQSPQRLKELIDIKDPDEREMLLVQLFSICKQMKEEDWGQLRLFECYDFADACFHCHIQDSHFVADVLGYIFDHYGNMYKFRLISFMNSPKLKEREIQNIRERGWMPFTYLTYFLHHATQARFTFQGRRITEQNLSLCYLHPLTIIWAKGKSTPVLHLLQYGASLEDIVNGRRESSIIDAQSRVFAKLLVWFMGIESDYMASINLEEETAPASVILKDSLKDSCLIFRLLMRSLMMPIIRSSDLINLLLRIEPLWKAKGPFLLNAYSTLFPDLAEGPRKPRSLKHLCRCHIRERLNENWQLPFGIQRLELPEDLRDYLNLLHD